MVRPSFVNVAAATCLCWATRSEDENTKTAAICFRHDNTVISTGYNGIKAGININSLKIRDRDDKLHFFVHGEINALRGVKAGECKTIVSVLSPCVSCALAVAAHQVESFYYIKQYHRCDRFKRIFKAYDIKFEQLDPAEIWKVMDAGIRLLED